MPQQGAVDDVVGVVAVERPDGQGVDRLHRRRERLQQVLLEGLVAAADEHDRRVPSGCPAAAGVQPCRACAFSAPPHSDRATPSSQPVEVTWSRSLLVRRSPSNIQ